MQYNNKKSARLMRQNAIKVEETNQMIEFVECDSSDISESMH